MKKDSRVRDFDLDVEYDGPSWVDRLREFIQKNKDLIDATPEGSTIGRNAQHLAARVLIPFFKDLLEED